MNDEDDRCYYRWHCNDQPEGVQQPTEQQGQEIKKKVDSICILWDCFFGRWSEWGCRTVGVRDWGISSRLQQTEVTQLADEFLQVFGSEWRSKLGSVGVNNVVDG